MTPADRVGEERGGGEAAVWSMAHDAHRERREVAVCLLDGREFVGHIIGMDGGKDGTFTVDVRGLPTKIGWQYVRSMTLARVHEATA